MQERMENQGLCSTCIHIQTCARYKHHQEAIWYCEEFDDYVPSPPKANRVKANDPDSSKSSDELPLYMGLCANCRNRETCKYPKPNGGIWHCEEYS